MGDAMLHGFLEVFKWPTFLYIPVGASMGFLFGALPGLGGPTVLAVLIPLTFAMDPFSAVVLLASSLGSVSFGASIPAILINTPGDSPNAATCFDGYPLARQGKAGMALGASACASSAGSLFGMLWLMALLPFAKSMVLAFSYPEIFMFALLGLSIIALLSEGDIVQGMAAGGIGVLLAFIGQNPISGGLRFTFGVNYFWDGVKLVPALIGIFAIAEAISLYTKGGTVADANMLRQNLRSMSGVWDGVKSVFQHFGIFIRSSTVGTLIGIVPGVGGTVANFIAYGQAVQTAKEPKFFGRGDIRGVIASEAANDSKDGGALLPTVAFGIPGSASTAVLLGGFVLHGIAPGPQLVTENMDLIFSLIVALVTSNLITSCIGLATARYMAYLTLVPATILAPLILVIALLGAYALNTAVGDVVVAVVFGFAGYWLGVHKFPRVPIIIGLVLGLTVERAFHFTLISRGAISFVTRPISLSLFLLVLAVLLTPTVKAWRSARKARPRRLAA